MLTTKKKEKKGDGKTKNKQLADFLINKLCIHEHRA